MDDLLNKADENLKKNSQNKKNIYHLNWNFRHCILDIYNEEKSIAEKQGGIKQEPAGQDRREKVFRYAPANTAGEFQ